MNQSDEQEMLAARGRPVTVGKYRVLAELGRGGMANVYLAVIRGPAGIGKLVVLKALLPELACQPEALAMFLDEARLATQLNHANVVQTYEVGTEGERHVIVMEYLDGQPLSAVLHRARASGEPLTMELSLSILLSVLDGLHYAHELRSYDGTLLSLVHRDVSPHNVFVCYDGQVKVLDFGIAKVTSSANTASGLLKGKIAYMPPEQMSGSQLDRRADIFAVGCMLWDVAAGRKLWKDVPNASIYRKVMNGEIPSPSTVNPACDAELERITMKALAPEPDARYSTALALHQDLERYAERFRKHKAKDVGAYVAKLFAESRQELKAVLEKQLAALRVEDERSRSYSSKNEFEAQRTHLASSIDVANTGRSTREVQTKLRPRLGYWVGFAVLGSVSIAAVGVRAFASADPAPQAAVVEGTPPAVHADTERSAVITFAATPPGAKLVLDGELLEGTTAIRRFPIDGRVHRLDVTADGHFPVVREFTVDKDAPIEVALRKIES
ncbi:MAG TPA: serine/threonine-protein kinase, partial [Polyangiaceae bacterium]